MKVLDLFCGAGGAAMGYHQAGFEVTGIDTNLQPHYPFAFIQGDALEPPVDLDAFDLIHASPPCQGYSWASKKDRNKGKEYPKLIAPIRQMIRRKPYIIENVVGAPLKKPITLCGEMFGLKVIRHRLFETNLSIFQPTHQKHRGKAMTYRRDEKESYYYIVAGHMPGTLKEQSDAMGIHWMKKKELVESIPPAYTKFLGKQAIRILKRRKNNV